MRLLHQVLLRNLLASDGKQGARVQANATESSASCIADPEAKGGYFDYSIDELGLQDIKAADEVINSLALKELGCGFSMSFWLSSSQVLCHIPTNALSVT